MALINAQLATAIGHELSPEIAKMDENTQEMYKKTLESIANKELEALKIEIKIKELKVIAKLAEIVEGGA